MTLNVILTKTTKGAEMDLEKNYQGEHKREEKIKNRARIVEWCKNNRGSMKKCSDDLDLHYNTVRMHFAELRVEQEVK